MWVMATFDRSLNLAVGLIVGKFGANLLTLHQIMSTYLKYFILIGEGIRQANLI